MFEVIEIFKFSNDGCYRGDSLFCFICSHDSCNLHRQAPYIAMDNLLPARRLATFAASTAVVIDNVGHLYPRCKFAELLTDIMFRKCSDKRSSSSAVRKAMSKDTCLQ